MDAPIAPWATSTAPVRASARALDVWRADLARVDDPIAGLLCADEQARAQRIRDVHKRQLWIRSRGVLRALLARYLDGDPRALRFTLGPHGKPALRAASGSRDRGDLHFNLSHSGAVALYAVTAGHAVGIDVELARSRPLDELAIAERVLGDEHAQRLAALDPPERTREFLRAWVAHEAAAKCRGTGLGTPPADLAADLRAAEPDLWTAELDVGPDAAAAVAVEGGRYELRCWEWSG